MGCSCSARRDFFLKVVLTRDCWSQWPATHFCSPCAADLPPPMLAQPMGKATLRVLRGMGSAVFELELASLPSSWLQSQSDGYTRVSLIVTTIAENSPSNFSPRHLRRIVRVVLGPSLKEGSRWVKMPRVVTNLTVFPENSFLYAENTVTVVEGGEWVWPCCFCERLHVWRVRAYCIMDTCSAKNMPLDTVY